MRARLKTLGAGVSRMCPRRSEPPLSVESSTGMFSMSGGESGEPCAARDGGQRARRTPAAPVPLAAAGTPTSSEPKRETWLPIGPTSTETARALVREAAAEAGLGDDCTWDLVLATTEAVTNAVEHGRAWPNECILLTTEPCARGLRVEVCDRGTFESTLEPAALDATSGRGVQIIAAVVDRLEMHTSDGRTLVRFERHAAAA